MFTLNMPLLHNTTVQHAGKIIWPSKHKHRNHLLWVFYNGILLALSLAILSVSHYRKEPSALLDMVIALWHVAHQSSCYLFFFFCYCQTSFEAPNAEDRLNRSHSVSYVIHDPADMYTQYPSNYEHQQRTI